MVAAVAKAPEKNKVPGSPQVLGDFLSQWHRGKQPPFNLLQRTICNRSHVEAACYWQDFLGKMKVCVKTTTNKKPNQSTEPFLNFLNFFKPTCWGRREVGHHRAPTSDLENIEDKILIKKSCCFRSQDGGVLRLGGRWPHVSPVWSSVLANCDSSQASIHWMFQSFNACFVSWKTIVLTYKRHKNQINTLLSNTIYNRGC